MYDLRFSRVGRAISIFDQAHFGLPRPSTPQPEISAMIWIKIKDQNAWLCAPYRIYQNTQGFDLWTYGKQNGVIGRQIGSLKLAQDMAEVHRNKHAQRPA
jgi:hypothetical protein